MPAPWAHSSMSAERGSALRNPGSPRPCPGRVAWGPFLQMRTRLREDRAARGHMGPTSRVLTPGPAPGAAPGLLRLAEAPLGTRHSLDQAQVTPERHGFGLRASTYPGTFFNKHGAIHPRVSHPCGNTDTEDELHVTPGEGRP